MSEGCPATFQAYQNLSSVVGANDFPIVLWAPSIPIPGEHGKTLNMRLGINNVVAPGFAIPGECGKTFHMRLT